MYPIFCSFTCHLYGSLVIDSFLSVWGISVFDAFSSKPLLPKFHAQFIRKDSRLTPSILHRVLFWTESLSKSVKTCDEGSIFAIPVFFPLNSISTILVSKNYLILYAKQKKSGSESSASFLKQSRGLKALVALFYPDLPWVPLPRALLYPPCRMMQLVSQKIVYIVISFFF